ncbi:MAG: hypothetical protein HKO60_01840 [Pseudomonadales bacterium]|nr:hypothetical protein [Pseudomonadales bacterium]
MLVLSCFSLSASASTVVPVPPGLSPGDEYRLVFVTSGSTDAISSNIADYNTFVQSFADTAGLGPGWTAIASTSTVDARDNTQTSSGGAYGNGIPIYRLDGALVVTDYIDLWDGFLLNPADGVVTPINIDEQGSLVNDAEGAEGNVWTGTKSGYLTGDGGAGFDNEELGTATPVDGYTGATSPYWIEKSQQSPQSSLKRIYAMSSVLTVAPIPIPAAGWLFVTAIAGTIVVKRKNR